jgi:YesN/AraC family two-component response regulator
VVKIKVLMVDDDALVRAGLRIAIMVHDAASA